MSSLPDMTLNSLVRATEEIHIKLKTFCSVEENMQLIVNAWSSLTRETRAKLLRIVQLHMPNSVEDPYTIIDGRRENFKFITALCPELNLKSMIPLFVDLLHRFVGKDFKTLWGEAASFFRSKLQHVLSYSPTARPGEKESHYVVKRLFLIIQAFISVVDEIRSVCGASKRSGKQGSDHTQI